MAIWARREFNLNIEDKINQEEKECYTLRIVDYIAETIAINYKYFKNNHKTSFDMFYKQGFDVFSYTEEEKQEMYDLIEDLLQQNYGLIRINKGFNKTLILKDLNEEG